MMFVVLLFFVHGVIFHALRNLHHFLACCGDLIPLQNGIASPRLQVIEESHLLYTYFFFIKMRFNKDAKVWTYLPIILGPLDWRKFSFYPTFRIWLWGVNFSFSLALNALWGKLPIKFGSISFRVVHHSMAWSLKRDCANLSQSTSVLIAWDSK